MPCRTNHFEGVTPQDFFETVEAFLNERSDIPWANPKEGGFVDRGVFMSEFQQKGGFGGVSKRAFLCFLLGVYVSQAIFSKHRFVDKLMLWGSERDILTGFLFDSKEWYFDEDNLLKLSKVPDGVGGRSQRELSELYHSVHEFNELFASFKPFLKNHSCETRAQDMNASLGDAYDRYFKKQTKSDIKPLQEFLAFFEKRFISQAIVHQEGVVSTFGRKM